MRQRSNKEEMRLACGMRLIGTPQNGSTRGRLRRLGRGVSSPVHSSCRLRKGKSKGFRYSTAAELSQVLLALPPQLVSVE